MKKWPMSWQSGIARHPQLGSRASQLPVSKLFMRSVIGGFVIRMTLNRVDATDLVLQFTTGPNTILLVYPQTIW